MCRKRMTIQITGLLTAVFLLFLTVQPVLAADGEQSISIRRLPDGSYYETIVETAPSQPGALTSSRIFAPSGVYTVKKSKTTRYRSASGSVLWFVKVTGTFRYGKGSSICLSSRVTAKSRNKRWKVSNRTARKVRNRAIASATAKRYENGEVVQKIHKTVTLTCTASGHFYRRAHRNGAKERRYSSENRSRRSFKAGKELRRPY